MFPDDAAATHHRKADGALGAGAGHAVSAALRNPGEVDAPPLRGRGRQHQRRAGRRIHLAPVMGLEDLDVVVVGRQGAGGLAHQTQQEVHPQGIVPRLDDGDAGGGLAHNSFVGLGKPGRADDQRRAAAPGRQPRQGDGRLRSGEVDDDVAKRKGVRSAHDRASADVLADGIRPVDQGGQLHVGAGADDLGADPAHAAERSRQSDPDWRGSRHDEGP